MSDKVSVCTSEEIIMNGGRAALIDSQQVAIFKVKTDFGVKLFAIDNFCPFSKANVMSRGITGSLDGQIVVASPIYKQHFNLETGVCLEDDSISLKVWNVSTDGSQILIESDHQVAA